MVPDTSDIEGPLVGSVRSCEPQFLRLGEYLTAGDGLGGDADGGEEGLLVGVEVMPSVLLLGGPSLEVGGQAGVASLGGAGAVVEGLPGVGPGWVPPGVDGVQGLGGGGGEAAVAGFGALLAEPAAQGEAVVDGVGGRGEVADGLGVVAGVRDAGAGRVGPGCASSRPGVGGGDVDPGEEGLLLGMELVPGTGLCPGPGPQSGGKGLAGDVQGAGAVPGLLPGDQPGRIPPRVDGEVAEGSLKYFRAASPLVT